MKRSDIITKLISEGFTSETLSKFSDKEILTLSKKILGEAEIKTVQKTTYNSSNPKDKEELNKVLANPELIKDKEIEVKEESPKDMTIATKNEIMELVSSKLKKMNATSSKLPEFMTYDSIKSSGGNEVQTKPTTKPATPTTKPGQKPGQKPYNPYQPGPGINPRPKAVK